MSDTTKQNDWPTPAALALPKGGFFKDKVEQGRYGPIFPKTPACYGFSIIAKIIPGREEVFYEYARNIEKAVAGQPDILAVLKLHYLRWNLFDIKGKLLQYSGILTRLRPVHQDAVGILRHPVSAPFRNLGAPEVGRQTLGIHRSVRDHHRPGFLESGDIVCMRADGIKRPSNSRRRSRGVLDQCSDPPGQA
jgi:hypothetical protein